MQYITEGPSDACIFCVKPREEKDRQNLILHRGDLSYIIMNRFPYNNGHILIATYRHVEEFEFLTDEETLEVFQLARKGMNAIAKVMRPEGFNIGVNQGKAAGGSYRHFHLHVLPRWTADTNFMPTLADSKVISEHLRQTYRKLFVAMKS